MKVKIINKNTLIKKFIDMRDIKTNFFKNLEVAKLEFVYYPSKRGDTHPHLKILKLI